MGITKLVVVVNKMDESTVKWNKDRYFEIQTQLSPFIQACGYDVEKDVSWVPVSGLSGDNIKNKVSNTTCNWYNGPTLVETIDNLGLPARDANEPIRIPVLDKMKERGVVVFGKIEQGTVTQGDKLTLMPSNLVSQVQMIFNSKD